MNMIKTSWKDKLSAFTTGWMSFGIYFFIVAFFWASGVASVRSVFYLFILLPALALLPWARRNWADMGGQFTLWALAATGFIALSNLWGAQDTLSKLIRHWLMLAIWLAVAAFCVIRGHLNVSRLLRVLVAVAAVAAVAELVYFYGVLDNSLIQRLRAHGLAENSTLTAQLFGAMAVVAYTLCLQATRRRDWWLWFAAAGMCTLPVIFSQTRGAWLALGLVALAALILVRPPRRVVLGQVGLAVTAALLILGVLISFDLLANRGEGLSDRDLIWRELLARAYKNPLFGIGAVDNARIIIPDLDVFHHSHNPWIDTVYYAGLVGLFLALCQLQTVLSTFARDSETLPVYLWFVFGCVALFTNAPHLLMPINTYWMAYWVPAGLLAGLAIRNARLRTAAAA